MIFSGIFYGKSIKRGEKNFPCDVMSHFSYFSSLNLTKIVHTCLGTYLFLLKFSFKRSNQAKNIPAVLPSSKINI